MNNEVRVNYNWKKRILVPLGTLALVIIIYLFAFNKPLQITGFHITSVISLLFLYYLFFSQFEVSNVKLDLHDKVLIVSFPISVLKQKVYKLNEIKEIRFKYSPGPYGPPKFFIYLMNGRKKRHYIPDNIEYLAEKLKEEGVNIKID